MISGRGGSGARGGRIRPPRRFVRSNGEGADFDDCWHMLEEALRDIHNKSSGRLSFEELYRAAYKIVLIKKGAVLYQRVKQFEEQWFTTHVIPKIESLVTKNLINIGVDRSSSVNERRRTGEKFLLGVRDTWQDHNMSMNMTADILMYMDRGYTQQESNRVPIFTTTIALFRDHILRSCLNANSSQLVIDLVISIMLDQIDMEREGDVIDRNLLRSCSRMLSCLYEAEEENELKTLYLTVFQPRFLASSHDFYSRECLRLLRDADASTWLRHTQRRLSEEVDRCETTIESETLVPVMKVIDLTLIESHLDEFLSMEGSGLRWMIDNDKVEDLSILYRLISRTDPNKTALRDMLQKRVVELGLEIEQVLKNTDFTGHCDEAGGGGGGGGGGEGADKANKTLNQAAQQTASAVKWVDDVLRLKDKFDKLLSECFDDDLVIQTALTKSFTDFIRLFARSSEYVSLYIDDNLKRGIRGKTEAEVDEVLDKAIVLIRYLPDRDLFQTYYQRHLGRRLLHGKSESHDVEKQILSRMKQELGQEFTSRFEGMFRDLGLSSELTSAYRAHMDTVGDDGNRAMDLNISVLTTNYWPQEVMGRQASVSDRSRVSCNFPHEVRRVQASFEQFYLATRNGRKLTWVASTGSADMRCTFPAVPGKSGPLARERRYELNVPTFAMAVLLLFNDLDEGESLSFEEIQAKTDISTSDLMRTLTAVAVAPKSRVLVKEPANKSVKQGDRFSFNASFQSKAVRIKAPIISAVSKAEDTQERKTTQEKTNESRAHTVDAAIVRIMKSRKQLSHTQLVNEVIGQMSARFKPEVALIKKRIEDLIGREYLERPDEEAPTMYRYPISRTMAILQRVILEAETLALKRAGKVVCIGRNYADHISELRNATPRQPFFFLKPPSSILLPGQGPCVRPRGVQMHFEVELGLVMGKRVRDLAADDVGGALKAIRAYVVAIDMTARNVQDEAKKKGLPWSIAKGFDTFLPVSRVIGKESIPDPQAVELFLDVNGQSRQRGSTALMLHPIPRILSDISRVMTLDEGDVVLTGTPAGVGPVVPGDVMRAGVVVEGREVEDGGIEVAVEESASSYVFKET
ncbi:hypothetical protein CP533_0750 [Ophiocordyceps camponoti-saundersi (nom. inval.)]|nr:hypothetical protein CP533_0750 [Ophiocordyceps camponoti-saundersi (nom. inval.)]